MILGIIGGGVTGRATARAFLEHVDEVRVFDLIPERRTHHTYDEVMASDLIFVHLTEQEVEGWVQQHATKRRDGHYVIRSTVKIGTTRHLRERYELTNVCHSPEFLTARCSIVDAQMPARNVIGRPNGMANHGSVALQDLYAKRFPGVQTYWMTSCESEALKLIQNAYFTSKIAFMNEANTLCAAMGLDWDMVRRALLADGRVHPSHTRVPGPSGEFGVGGHCLVKDTQEFARAVEACGLPASVTRGALARNLVDRERKG